MNCFRKRGTWRRRPPRAISFS